MAGSAMVQKTEKRSVLRNNIDAIGFFIAAAGDLVATAVEFVGAFVNDTFNTIGYRLGIKLAFSWSGCFIKGVFSLAAAIIKGMIGLVGGLVVGPVKILGGIGTLNGSLILEGFWDICSSIAGAVIVVAGKLVALIQSIIYAQDFERPLTQTEKSALQRVFRDSLNYPVIRLIEGHGGLFGINTRPFTLGNTIYLKTDIFPIDLLVHETTHVWQYQSLGPRYTSDALAAQWFVNDAYNWQKEISERGKSDWLDFNSESQAEFIADLWKYGELRDPSGDRTEWGHGSFYSAETSDQVPHFSLNGTNYSDIATEAVNVIHRKTPLKNPGN